MAKDMRDGDDETIIEVKKLGNNTRRIEARMVTTASFEAIWNVLTDYGNLENLSPTVAVSKLIEKDGNVARICQIIEQNLAFGFKVKPKLFLDCCEKELETFGHGKRREIEFKMTEGDFEHFEGKWSTEQWKKMRGEGEECTVLSYSVDVKPKMWLPVALIEGRFCKEVKANLLSIQEEAMKAMHHHHTN